MDSPRCVPYMIIRSSITFPTKRMAAVEVDVTKRALEDQEHVPRKRFKTSELPLNPSQRSTIDSLLHTIKKKGEYDTLRKQVWAQYVQSVRHRDCST